MKRIFNGFNLIVVLITNFTISSVCAQNTIQFGGSEIQWGSNTDSIIEDPLNDPKLQLIPQEGSQYAEAQIVQGSETTRLRAKTITYFTRNEHLIMEGNARIDQGKNYLIGPSSIEFNSEKNVLIARGTAKSPADFYYLKNDGQPWLSKSREITFIFENRNGSRYLKTIKTAGNINTNTELKGGSSKQPGQTLVPRLSGGK
ncbi:MAG: LptA/OstA family protein [bacterium]|jgi:hypothetical protein